MKAVFVKRDKQTRIAMIVYLAIITLYLIGVAIWVYLEWNKPLAKYSAPDGIGWSLAVGIGRKIHYKLFKKDRG